MPVLSSETEKSNAMPTALLRGLLFLL